jgi:hypothetical protein
MCAVVVVRSSHEGGFALLIPFESRALLGCSALTAVHSPGNGVCVGSMQFQRSTESDFCSCSQEELRLINACLLSQSCEVVAGAVFGCAGCMQPLACGVFVV